LLGSVTGAGSVVWSVTDATFHVFTSAFSPAGLLSLFHQVASPAAAQKARASGTQAVSVYGATQLIADAARAGTEPLLGILISLNISLGVLNMLPMLPLDGGHVAIALYERLRTRRGKPRYRADVRKLMPVVYAFLGFLLLFVAGKMYLDIAHGTANPFG
jgi:membrane-associated protease RseP (regulator of RpoE activity)